MPRLVVVDATASEAVVPFYLPLLEAGVAVVTPNKRSNTMDVALYRQLHAFHDTLYRYESTGALVDCLQIVHSFSHVLFSLAVMAGLPVISTLQDLRRTGDSVLAIEGCFSGTLAFLFDSLARGKSFRFFAFFVVCFHDSKFVFCVVQKAKL